MKQDVQTRIVHKVYGLSSTGNFRLLVQNVTARMSERYSLENMIAYIQKNYDEVEVLGVDK